MVPLCILLGLWDGYMQERRMDLGMDYETSYITGWSWCEKRNHRPGFSDNPYTVHSFMKVRICGIPSWSSGWATVLSLPRSMNKINLVKQQDSTSHTVWPGEKKKKLRNIRFKTNLPGHYESLFVCCCCCCCF